MPREGALRRLLFFAYYFPPLGGAGSQRALSFARHLPSHDWEVTVICPREGVFGTDPSLQVEDIEGTKVVRTGTWEPAVLLRRLLPSTRGKSILPAGGYVDEAKVGALGAVVRSWAREKLYFPDSSRGWIGPAYRAASRAHALAPFDAVLSSSPPVSAHVVADRFASRYRVPWIADWRDLWTDRSPIPLPQMGKARDLEAGLLSRASGVLAAMDGLRDHLQRRRDKGSIETVRNGFEPGEFAAEKAPPRAEGPFRIVYTGTLYGPEEQCTNSLFTAIRRTRSQSASRSVLVIFLGKVHPAALEAARSCGLDDIVKVEGFVPHDRCLDAMAGAHLLLLLATDKGRGTINVEVPAKTYEYLAARRPILALADPESETGRLLEKRAGVWICPMGNADVIESALREAMALQDPVLPPWPDIQEFTREAQAAKVAAVLDRVVAERGR